MKKIISILLIILFSNFFVINNVNAENIFNNKDEAAEKFDYEDEADDSTVESQKDSSSTSFNNEDKESNHSAILVVIEVFCGLVGVIMVFLAFKANEE